MADPGQAPDAAYPPPQNPAYPQIDDAPPPAEPYPSEKAPPPADFLPQGIPPGYPAQPPEYPAQQPGYPPQQPGYPAQQPGYPAQQPGYPPQQPEYPPPPQPQQGYPPASYPQASQQQTNTTVVIQQPGPTALPTPVFRDHPVVVVDSNGQQVQTVLRYRAGCLTWLICCLICWLTGGCWILAIIPCCINGTKDVVHITPTDGRIVGVYKRL